MQGNGGTAIAAVTCAGVDAAAVLVYVAGPFDVLAVVAIVSRRAESPRPDLTCEKERRCSLAAITVSKRLHTLKNAGRLDTVLSLKDVAGQGFQLRCLLDEQLPTVNMFMTVTAVTINSKSCRRGK